MLIYCRKCLLPNSKPYITFDAHGICGACRAHEKKNRIVQGISWSRRREAFEKLLEDVKAKKAPYFDAVVPVSGGKDSLTQVHRLLGRDLRILAVHVDYGIKTEWGRHNLQLVPRMGAHLMTFTPERPLQTRLVRIGFEDFGDPDLLSHTLLHAFPLRAALQYKVPLVLLGENSAFEYGGDKQLAGSTTITRAWFSRYAANAGRDAWFVSRQYRIPYERLRVYDFPDELTRSNTRAVFMSFYFHWDSETHLRIAKRYGFRHRPAHGEGTYRNYVGIDEKLNRLHQYLKVLKFGYGRATDHACEDIRNGRLTRQQAKKLVRRYDLEDLSEPYIRDFSDFMGISRSRFLNTLEKYRNRDIWRKNGRGRWSIPGHLED